MAAVTTLVFAKFPSPGLVKTRMVPPLTPDQAAELHAASLHCVIEGVREVDDLEVQLVVTPDESPADFRAFLGGSPSEIWSQGDGDLGDRLLRAVRRAFENGSKGVLLLGADSPTVPKQFLTTAIESLPEHDAVLGPCVDGGYYLLGMRRILPVLFEQIEWGSPRVAAQTRMRAAQAGLSLFELPEWYDLDTFQDLRRARDDLSTAGDTRLPASESLYRLIAKYVERYTDGGAYEHESGGVS